MRNQSHGGNPDKSMRLRLTLSYLRMARGGRTTLLIQEHTGSMAPSTDIADLRKAGHDISCEYEGMENRRRIYRYHYHGRYLNG